jgi:hypothetical protein
VADELLVLASLRYERDNVAAVIRSNPTTGGDVYTQKTAGPMYVSRIQNITTSAALLDLGDIVQPGWCYLEFKSGTATIISIRDGVGGGDLVALEPGEFACFRFDATATPAAKTDSSTADLEYFVCGD